MNVDAGNELVARFKASASEGRNKPRWAKEDEHNSRNGRLPSFVRSCQTLLVGK